MSNESEITVENGLDLILLLLLAAEKTTGRRQIQGSTRLQKLLFLLWKEGDFAKLVSDLYGFKAYDFGPCLADIYDDLDLAESIGLISTNDVPIGDAFDDADANAFLQSFHRHATAGKKRRDYTLTAQGAAAAHDLWNSLDQKHQHSLQRVFDQFGTMPVRKLLQYVYSKYPKFAEKSKIADSL